MPRTVRNWWVEVTIDGQKTQLSGGPKAKDGGFFLRIHQRKEGQVKENVMFITGDLFEDDTLRLTATTESGALFVKTQR